MFNDVICREIHKEIKDGVTDGKIINIEIRNIVSELEGFDDWGESEIDEGIFEIAKNVNQNNQILVIYSLDGGQHHIF